MRDVYKGSQVTLIAATAKTSDSGIFSKREPPVYSCHLPWRLPSNGGLSEDREVLIREYSGFGGSESESAVEWDINSRGWTLQEDLLSWRTITYGSKMTYWKCPSLQIDESGRRPVGGTNTAHRIRYFYPLDRKGVGAGTAALVAPPTSADILQRQENRAIISGAYSVRDLYSQWYTIVGQFTDRLLTCETDALPALSGLAREYESLLDDAYCAGIWKKDIIRGLLWRRVEYREAYKRGEKHHIFTTDGPSWSWAGISGAGHAEWFHHRSMSAQDEEDLPLAYEVARLIDTKIETGTADPFGQILPGRGVLFLEAPFLHLALIDNADLEDNEWLYYSNFSINSMWKDDIASLTRKPYVGQHFGLVPLVANTAARSKGLEFLLLESTENSATEYRRLDWLSISGGEHDWASDNESFQKRRALLDKVLISDKWPVKKISLV